MRARLGPLFALALASCATTQQKLSRSIYERGVRAARYEKLGAWEAARAERQGADRERDRLARSERLRATAQPTPR